VLQQQFPCDPYCRISAVLGAPTLEGWFIASQLVFPGDIADAGIAFVQDSGDNMHTVVDVVRIADTRPPDIAALAYDHQHSELYALIDHSSLTITVIRTTTFDVVRTVEHVNDNVDTVLAWLHVDEASRKLYAIATVNAVNNMYQVDAVNGSAPVQVLRPPTNFFFAAAALDNQRRIGFAVAQSGTRELRIVKFHMSNMTQITMVDPNVGLVSPFDNNVKNANLHFISELLFVVFDFTSNILVMDVRDNLLQPIQDTPITVNVQTPHSMLGMINQRTAAAYMFGQLPTAQSTSAWTVDRLSFDRVFCPPGYNATTAVSAAANYSIVPCRSCAPGEYVTMEQWGRTCSTCPAGRYAVLGQCFDCPSGTASAIVGSTFANCQTCEPGTFALNGSTTCTDCGTGRFSNSSGSSVCLDCSAGRFSPRRGEVDCRACTAGTYNRQVAMSSCQQCTPGTATLAAATSCTPCEAGFFADTNGTAVCQACSRGTFQNSSKSSLCIPCYPGRYADTTRAIQCTSCAKGRYSSDTGAVSSVQCIACTGGKTTRYAGSDRETQCTLCQGDLILNPATDECECAPGRQPRSDAPATCDSCTGASFKRTIGNQQCGQCPFKAFSILNATTCRCESGYYATDNNGVPIITQEGQAQSFANLSACLECPGGGAICERGQLQVRDGFWRPSVTSLSFYKCFPASACENQACAANYDGVRCGSCKRNYVSNSNGECVYCPESRPGAIVLQLLPVLFFVPYVYFSAGNSKLVRFSILVNFVQIAAQLPSRIDSGFIDALSLSEFDFLSLGTSTCSFALHYKWQWFLRLFVPVILTAVLALWTIVMKAAEWCYLRYRGNTKHQQGHMDESHDSHSDSAAAAVVPEIAVSAVVVEPSPTRSRAFTVVPLTKVQQTMTDLQHFGSAVLSILLFTYVLETKTALSAFSCEKIEGVEYLTGYVGIECWSSLHYRMVSVALVFFTVFSIGVPTFLAFLLIPQLRARAPWITKFVYAPFLLDPYRNDETTTMAWELMISIRRLCVIAIVATLIDERKEMLCSMVVILTVFWLQHVLVKPFASVQNAVDGRTTRQFSLSVDTLMQGLTAKAGPVDKHVERSTTSIMSWISRVAADPSYNNNLESFGFAALYAAFLLCLLGEAEIIGGSDRNRADVTYSNSISTLIVVVIVSTTVVLGAFFLLAVARVLYRVGMVASNLGNNDVNSKSQTTTVTVTAETAIELQAQSESQNQMAALQWQRRPGSESDDGADIAMCVPSLGSDAHMINDDHDEKSVDL
jgi:Tyrosine-protein kinase ephrin type A/B receptor-like